MCSFSLRAGAKLTAAPHAGEKPQLSTSGGGWGVLARNSLASLKKKETGELKLGEDRSQVMLGGGIRTNNLKQRKKKNTHTQKHSRAQFSFFFLTVYVFIKLRQNIHSSSHRTARQSDGGKQESAEERW